MFFSPTVSATPAPTPASTATLQFAIPAGPATETLRKFSAQCGPSERLFYAADAVAGISTHAVHGEFAPKDALARMLAGTDLVAVIDAQSGANIIMRASPPAETAGNATTATRASPTASHSTKRKSPLTILSTLFAFVIGSGHAGHAADGTPAAASATGAMEGRVLHVRTGQYLENARVSVEGTSHQTFSDADGRYRLTALPPGPLKVRVFFTGTEPHSELVEVPAGGIAQHDFRLGGGPTAAGPGGVVKLDQFVVDASREMDGTAIAINEQRFAPNIKNVLSTDEFGFVAEGNMAEFLKFVPGVTVIYSGGNAREISIEGVPANNVPISIDGFSIGTAHTSTDTSRSVELDMVSTNSASRIEVVYSPTPESPGAALAGSVNMVTRSAFERTRPVFNGSAYIMMRDNARDFHKSPYIFERTRKVHPGFDFSYVAPVNRRFGFTISGGHSTQYALGDSSGVAWRGVESPTNGTTFPHTEPGRPYLSQYSMRPEPKTVERNSLSATVDYKLAENSRLSLSLLFASYATTLNGQTLTFAPNAVLPDFTPTRTNGVPGAGSIQLSSQVRHRRNRTYMPSLAWRHTGLVWKLEAGAGRSRQKDDQPDIDLGRFLSVSVRRTGLTVGFDDMFYLRPRIITVRDAATGADVDPGRLDNYAIVSGSSNHNYGSDLQLSTFANARRDFHTRLPFSLKGGLDFRRSLRDLNSKSRAFTYVGPDGRASTDPRAGDDRAAPFADPVFAEMTAPFGFGHIERVDNRKVWEHYQSNPSYFTTNPNTDYRNEVMNSKRAEENISSGYLRGDLQLLDRRLKLIGGVRAEQTNVEAQGPLTDPTGNFQRDAVGRIVLGPNGRPLPIATDALEVSKRTLLRRGAHAKKEYLRLFPSVNASYEIRDNLLARASYYHSVGRPNFNQYAGGVVLPDTENPPSTSNRITVSNVAIKAWSARTVKVRFEYYFAGVGQLAVGGFRRDFENFFGSTVFATTPEFLSLYGMDPEIYGQYQVATQYNIASAVRMHGVDINYKQALTFLPHWGRGLQVFANGTTQRATGDATSNFAGYAPRSASWGWSLTREKFNVRMNWSYTGRRRAGAVAAGSSIEPGTYNWRSKKMTLDILGEYYFWRRVGVFASLRNVGDEPDDTQIEGPSTPEHAQFNQRLQFGSLWTFGIKATF